MDRILYGARGGRLIPGCFLLHLGRIIHSAVFIVGGKICCNTIGAVGHFHPAFTDITNYVDFRMIRIRSQPILRHTLTAHLQFLKSCVIRGDVYGIVKSVLISITVFLRMTRHWNGDIGKLQAFHLAVTVHIHRQLGLQILVHRQKLLHIPLGSFHFVRTTLTPKVTHVRQGVMPCLDFFLQRFLTGLEQQDAFFIVFAALLPGGDGTASMGRIDDPHLFSGLLYPLISIAAVRTLFARTLFVKQIDGPIFQTGLGTVDIPFTSYAGQRTGNKIGGICGGHGITVTIGSINHAVRTDNRLICIAF